VVVSGPATGEPADPEEVAAVSRAVGMPTIVGSGITAENIGSYAGADAFFVGSAVKHDGRWSGELDAMRTRALLCLQSSERAPLHDRRRGLRVRRV